MISTRVGRETLVYDPATQRSHRLDAAGAALFAACDGRTPLEEAAATLHPDVAPDAARDALAVGLRRLHRAGILEDLPEVLPRLSRRGFLARWGKVAVALPVVSSLLIPRPAHAYSGPCVDCAGDAFVCSACSAATACSGCSNPGVCADCTCLLVKRKTGASCASDSTAGVLSCLDMSVAQPALVNPDCATARANAAAGGETVTICGGAPSVVNAGAYLCCTNCT